MSIETCNLEYRKLFSFTEEKWETRFIFIFLGYIL